IDPPLQALRMIPHLALIPVFIVWFGIGETSKVALILIGPLFPIYLNVLHGIRGVDNRLVEAATSFGLGRLAVIRRVILPGALPPGLRGALRHDTHSRSHSRPPPQLRRQGRSRRS